MFLLMVKKRLKCLFCIFYKRTVFLMLHKSGCVVLCGQVTKYFKTKILSWIILSILVVVKGQSGVCSVWCLSVDVCDLGGKTQRH